MCGLYMIHQTIHKLIYYIVMQYLYFILSGNNHAYYLKHNG